MSRAKRPPASRRRRKKILDQAKGYRGGGSKLYRTAVEKLHKGWQYAYQDRRLKKRTMRALWITRIGIASHNRGLSYSHLIAGLNKAQVHLDRKILSTLAVSAPNVFDEIVQLAKSQVS